MLGFLPFAATLMWAVWFYVRAQEGAGALRWSLAASCVILGTFTLAITEILSASHALSFVPVLVSWVVYLVVPALLLLFKWGGINWLDQWRGVLRKISAIPLWMKFLLLAVSVLVPVMALATPPNNYDVQCYHLPRQVYWLMEGSVEPFEATYSYQNAQPVLTEFLGLNLMILSGGDFWHNLVQGMFLVAACGLVTMLAQSIGAGARGQALAVLFVVLAPVVFFEASNAKNDIVVSFFILLPLLIGLRLWLGRTSTSFGLLALASLSAGLAVATKGTAVAYLPSAALLIAAACFRHGQWRRLIFAALPCAVIALAPFAPLALRNIRTYHAVAGETSGLINASHAPKALLGIAVKDVANQFVFPYESANASIERGIRCLLLAMGVDPDDSQTSIQTPQLPDGKFHFLCFVGSEDFLPTPLQAALGLLIPWFFLVPSFRRQAGSLVLACAAVMAFLFFCSIFRWQPWIGRLLIPLWFMTAPLVGRAQELFFPRWIPLLLSIGAATLIGVNLYDIGPRHLEGGGSIFAISKEEQMDLLSNGRTQEIQAIVAALRQRGATVVLVDGQNTPIYGLLRQLRKSLPSLKIRSGPAAKASGEDVVVEALGEQEQKDPLSPERYRLFWKGSYYRCYECRP